MDWKKKFDKPLQNKSYLFLLTFSLCGLFFTSCHYHQQKAAEQPVRKGVSGKAVKSTVIQQLTHPPERTYLETGLASYYGKGDGFQGRLTANGEVYDKNELTAAHRELPFGSEVKVTNLENNRSVTVRINDRGPFIDARVIDLSYFAARKLGFVEQGLVEVKLEIFK